MQQTNNSVACCGKGQRSQKTSAATVTSATATTTNTRQSALRSSIKSLAEDVQKDTNSLATSRASSAQPERTSRWTLSKRSASSVGQSTEVGPASSSFINKSVDSEASSQSEQPKKSSRWSWSRSKRSKAEQSVGDSAAGPAGSAYISQRTSAAPSGYFSQREAGLRSLTPTIASRPPSPCCQFASPLPPPTAAASEYNLAMLQTLGELNACTKGLMRDVSETTALMLQESIRRACCPPPPPPPPPTSPPPCPPPCPPPPPQTDPLILQTLLELKHEIANLDRGMRTKAERACEARRQARDVKPAMQETFQVIRETIRALRARRPAEKRALAAAQAAAAAATRRALVAEEQAQGGVHHLLRDIRDSLFMLQNRDSSELEGYGDDDDHDDEDDDEEDDDDE